jgi:hypothetical protein
MFVSSFLHILISSIYVFVRMRNPVRQPLKENCAQDFQIIFRNVVATLKNRHDNNDIAATKVFFQSLPKTNEDIHPSYFNTFEYLYSNFGGEIVFNPKKAAVQNQRREYSGLCSITFNGGPVSRIQRMKKLKELGIDEQRKRKKTDNNDNDNNYEGNNDVPSL